MDEASTRRYRERESALWREKGATVREQWIEVSSLGIRVRVQDLGSGAPTLFVHGAPSGGTIWAALVAGLRGRRCLVLDRPGCGLSDAMTGGLTASPDALAEVQVAALDGLGVERADVVGNSFGGACVLWLAERHPERVDRIVLEGAPTIAGIRPRMFNRIAAAGPLGRIVARRRSSSWAIREVYRQVGHGRLVASGWPAGAELAWLLSLNNDTNTLHNETALLQCLGNWRAFRHAALFDPAAMSRIRHATLWLWGADEPYATIGEGRAWAAAMPAATFESIPGAGHLPWLDDPEYHARRIEAYLGAGAPADVDEVPIRP